MRWLTLLVAMAAAAHADPAPYGPPAPSPFAQCEAAITAATRPPVRLPATLLPAIARVESGRLDSATGRVRPWPWTINVEGTGSFFASKAEAVAAVQALQAHGTRSIDVGCMQVNLMHHPKAFADLDDAFDPGSNARYAVRFLSALYQQTKDWNLATAMYHSQTPDRGEEYQRLVFGRVLAPMGGQIRHIGPYALWPPPGVQFGAIPPVSFAFGALTAVRPTEFGVRLPNTPSSSFSMPSSGAAYFNPVTSGRPGRQ